MKKYIKAMLMSFTMFTAVPFCYHKWDEEARPLMTLFLPLVGAFTGGLWTLAAYILRWISAPVPVAAAVLCAFPFLITGGIHIDGYMDVTDAIRSWRGIEERRRILKDPHVGSFAAVYTVLLIAAQFALFLSAPADANLFALLVIAVVSRTVAAICVTLLRPMETSEYSGAYRKGIKKSHAALLFAVLALSVAAGFVFAGKYGFVSCAVIAGYTLHLIRAFRSLGGMSGDVSGYAMTFAELCGIAVFALI